MKKIFILLISLPLLSQVNAQSFDSTGLSSNWNSLINSYNTWEQGAFDAYRDPSNPSDFGWGNYDVTTHLIKGDSIYIIKTVAGVYKAVSIDQIASGTWIFTYSDLDGTNKVTKTIDRNNYPNRNFIYYSLDNEMIKDLEANNGDWDILFTKYLTVFPGFGGYPVSGALTNMSVRTSQVDFMPGGSFSVADTNLYPFSDNISTVGYDWKNAFAGVTYDTIGYIIQDQNGNVNELQFTDYSGSATGIFKFTVNGVADSVVLGTGNVNQVYYSLQNMTSQKLNQDNDWDMAFFAQSSFSSLPVRINDVNGIELYVYPHKDINHWNSIGLEENNPVNIISAFPNPSKDRVTLAINAQVERKLNYAIVDQMGRTVKSNAFDVATGVGEYEIDLSEVAKGIYLLQIAGPEFSTTTRLMVQP